MKNILYGSRIKLRRLDQFDTIDIFKNIQDQDIAFNTPLKVPYSMQECIQYIDKCNSCSNHQELGIQHYDSKEIFGVISVYNMHQDQPMIGYWVAKKYRSLGYAQEALSLMLNYCIKELKLKHLVATVFPSNTGSIRLLKYYKFKLKKQSNIKVRGKKGLQPLNHYFLTEAIAST